MTKDESRMTNGVSRAHLSAAVGEVFAGERALEIGGLKLIPDRTKAYLEIYIAHGFPVRTIDNTALHPQVVANSYRTMLHQVVDLQHFIKQYNPEEFSRDRILGAIVAVEFPPTPMGGWKVGASKASAPGIRAAAVIFKNAENVARILGEHQTGRRTWTVSMEDQYYLQTSGFAVENKDGQLEDDGTPEDLAALGWAYYPAVEAPDSLLECFDLEESKVKKKWQKREVVAMLGGLAGDVHFNGVGLTPVGKEKEAEIAQVLASADGMANGEEGNPLAPLEGFMGMVKAFIK